jgi:hypothetical protein
VAAPVASVVPCVTVKIPEVAEKSTAAPLTARLLASRTRAVMVAALELSDGICGRLVSTVTVCLVSATVTIVVFDALPEAAVTVIVVPAAAVPAVRVTLALPLASVVAGLPATVPAEVENVMLAPETALLLASVACAVIVAEAELSAGTVATLDVTLMVATAAPVPPPAGGMNALLSLPPHAESPSASAANTVIDANFLMSHPTLKTARRILRRSVDVDPFT